MRTIVRVSTAVLATAALSLACWSSVLAQPSFEMGLRAGLALSNVSGSNLKSTDAFFEDLGGGDYAQGFITSGIGDMKTGFVGGMYAMARVNERFGVRLEALYSMKGSKGKNSGGIGIYDVSNTLLGNVDVSGTNTLSLQYFELPLLAVVSFPAGPSSSFEVFAGPSLGFKSKAEFKTDITSSVLGQSDTQSVTTDLGDQVKSTDFGGVLGVGYTYKTGGMVVFGDARWTQGFSKIDDTGNADWTNHAIAVSMGIGIPLVGGK